MSKEDFEFYGKYKGEDLPNLKHGQVFFFTIPKKVLLPLYQRYWALTPNPKSIKSFIYDLMGRSIKTQQN